MSTDTQNGPLSRYLYSSDKEYRTVRLQMHLDSLTCLPALRTPLLAWCKALRSGVYTQGKQALRTLSGGFCCLGVLCASNSREAATQLEALSSEDAVDALDTLGTARISGVRGISLLMFPKATQELIKWLEGSREDSLLWESGSNTLADNLAGFNDDGGTFAEIADLLKAFATKTA